MPGHLLYDPDCGFCTKAAGWLVRRGFDCEIEPMTPSRLDELDVDLPTAARQIPFVDDQGRVTYGAQAFASALQTGSLPWRAAGLAIRLPMVSCLAQSVYQQVANNRQRLPGGTSSCQLP